MIFTAIHAVAAVCKLLQTLEPAKVARLATYVSGKRHSGKVEKPRRKSTTAKKEIKKIPAIKKIIAPRFRPSTPDVSPTKAVFFGSDDVTAQLCRRKPVIKKKHVVKKKALASRFTADQKRKAPGKKFPSSNAVKEVKEANPVLRVTAMVQQPTPRKQRR